VAGPEKAYRIREDYDDEVSIGEKLKLLLEQRAQMKLRRTFPAHGPAGSFTASSKPASLERPQIN
jgi:hypothetical protein